jgi:PIN domain nuclease of toxin-antitoxin system
MSLLKNVGKKLIVNEVILDASAVLALLFEESGHENLKRYIPGKISAINVAEM